MQKKQFYELYHRQTKASGRVIGKLNFTYYNVIRFLYKHALSDKSLNILDIGCGEGTLALYLAKTCHSVVGVDISSTAIKTAQINCRKADIPHCTFKVADVDSLKFEQKFDLIICSEILEHLPHYQSTLTNILKNLKAGGKLFVTVPSENAPLYRWGIAKNFDQHVGHLRRFSESEISEVLKTSGLKVLQTTKTESVFRNLLFVYPAMGWLIKFVRGPLVPIFHWFDQMWVKLLGESQIILLAQK